MGPVHGRQQSLGLCRAGVPVRKKVFGYILDAGFNFDFIDDEAIDLVGIHYAAVILPAVDRIPLATYQKIRVYALRGGVVIATRQPPHLAPGLPEGRRDIGGVQRISRELFKGQGARGLLVEDEKELGMALARRLTPDVELNPKSPEIGFIRRKLDSGELYFLANTGNRAQDVQAAFRAKGVSPERWDPFTATKSNVRWSIARDGLIVVPLHLEPYESAVLMFSGSRKGSVLPHRHASQSPASIDLSRDWKVSFAGTGKSVKMDLMRSWTELEGLRFFSGQGNYERNVSVPESMLKQGVRVYLDFGKGAPVVPAATRMERVPGLKVPFEKPLSSMSTASAQDPFGIHLTNWKLRPGCAQEQTPSGLWSAILQSTPWHGNRCPTTVS